MKIFDSFYYVVSYKLFETVNIDRMKLQSWFYLRSSPVERLFDVLRNLVANMDARIRHISRTFRGHSVPLIFHYTEILSEIYRENLDKIS